MAVIGQLKAELFRGLVSAQSALHCLFPPLTRGRGARARAVFGAVWRLICLCLSGVSVAVYLAEMTGKRCELKRRARGDFSFGHRDWHAFAAK